eukprot:4319177-Amphidinium_carterae.3
MAVKYMRLANRAALTSKSRLFRGWIRGTKEAHPALARDDTSIAVTGDALIVRVQVLEAVRELLPIRHLWNGLKH